MDLPGAIDISGGASCQRLFAIDQTALYVLDASDMTAPRITATFEVPGNATGVAVSSYERRALVSAAESGVYLGVVDVRSRVELTSLAPAAPGIQTFRLTWPDRFPDHPEQIAWHATEGQATVTELDQEAGAALVTWTGATAEATLTVAVGNHQYYELARSQ